MIGAWSNGPAGRDVEESMSVGVREMRMSRRPGRNREAVSFLDEFSRGLETSSFVLLRTEAEHGGPTRA